MLNAKNKCWKYNVWLSIKLQTLSRFISNKLKLPFDWDLFFQFCPSIKSVSGTLNIYSQKPKLQLSYWWQSLKTVTQHYIEKLFEGAVVGGFFLIWGGYQIVSSQMKFFLVFSGVYCMLVVVRLLWRYLYNFEDS